MHNYSQTFTKRRKRGIYYTPDELAARLSEWAIRTRDSRVMDPSFGGCAFLRASLDRLTQLHTAKPGRHVYGADIDPKAFRYLNVVLERGAQDSQFHIGDFLQLRRGHFEVDFETIVGNPPYVKHHALSQRLAIAAQRALRLEQLQLSKKASYWAYFVLHSMSFLRRSGRLAFVLPGSLLYTDYAYKVREQLCRSFAQVTALVLRERIFQDAQEETILLLADGRGDGKAELRLGMASVGELDLGADSIEHNTRPCALDGEPWLRSLLAEDVARVYSKLGMHSAMLREKATIHIGTVTGANDFFVMPPSVFRERSISKKLSTPILTRASQLRGLAYRQKAFKKLSMSDASCLLLRPPFRGPQSSGFLHYLREGVQKGIKDRYKCSIRLPWYCVPAQDPPDAFLTYMAGNAPRLVLNTARVTCTNAIHAIRWKKLTRQEAKGVVLGFLSTLTHLSAEIEGRSYGGGVLKLEPSEAGRLIIPSIPLSVVRSLFPIADALCADGRYQEATSLVDSALLKAKFLSRLDHHHLLDGLASLRKRRLVKSGKAHE